ncbi:MAG: hypothetical protein JNK82_22240 [Myxococcaceae bacterium]|nr:hypothetical protein [Myxococcaceae bacterium]
MRALLAAMVPLLTGCPKAAPEPEFEEAPLHIGPTMTQQQCDLIKYGGQTFDVDMQAVPLETALRGIADCTCFHFELKAGTVANITIVKQPKPLNADELFAEFKKAADAAGVAVRRDDMKFVVEPK